MPSVKDYIAKREAMVRLLRQRGIIEAHILAAFAEVPRHEFIDPAYRGQAYGDTPLPIEAGQTISQPYIVALMVQAAGIEPGAAVLEVGSGSGYAAAVISRIASRVVGIERQPELAVASRRRLAALGYDNIEIVEGDGTQGWAPGAPYDAILVAASGSHVPQPLIDQLKPGGTLVMPVGHPGSVQKLVRVTNWPSGPLRSDLCDVRFVPLIGEEGWSGD